MDDKRKGTTSGLVYVVVWGEAVIPMVRIPNIGKIAIYDEKTDSLIEGTIGWSVDKGAFVFT